MTLRENNDFGQPIVPNERMKESDQMAKDTLESERRIANDPNASKESREDTESSIELSDLQKQEDGVEAEFEAWQQPDVAFDQQAPILPSERTFERLAKYLKRFVVFEYVNGKSFNAG
jgi:hypothetical protein